MTKYMGMHVAGGAYGKGNRQIANALIHIADVSAHSPEALCGKVRPEHLLDDESTYEDAECATCKKCLSKYEALKGER